MDIDFMPSQQNQMVPHMLRLRNCEIGRFMVLQPPFHLLSIIKAFAFLFCQAYIGTRTQLFTKWPLAWVWMCHYRQLGRPLSQARCRGTRAFQEGHFLKFFRNLNLTVFVERQPYGNRANDLTFFLALVFLASIPFVKYSTLGVHASSNTLNFGN